MYNPYMQNNFMQQYMQPYTPQTNKLPPQQILQANGKESVDKIEMSPNSSILVMDNTAPIIWMCVSDGLGNTVRTPYDVKVHQEKVPTSIDTLEQRLDALEVMIHNMEGKINVQPNDAKPYANTDVTGYSAYPTNDELDA